MKKIVVFALLGVFIVYAMGRIKLSEGAAGNLLGDLDVQMMNGETEGLCDALHDDLEVSITASLGGEQTHVEGGREEFCDFMTEAAGGMRVLRLAQARIEVQRTEFTVERSWLHPWTAHYTYLEETGLHIPAAGVALNVESEGSATLVKTLSGVKLLKLESEQLSGG